MSEAPEKIVFSGFFSNLQAWTVIYYENYDLFCANISRKQQIYKLTMHYNTACHEIVDQLF